MERGNANEEPVLESLLTLFGGTVYRMGLVAHRQFPWLACSLDALLSLSTYYFLVEVKTKVTRQSQAAAIEKRDRYFTEPGKITMYFDFDTTDPRFRELCEHPEQILHQAAVLDWPFVMYVVASTTQIIYVLIVSVNRQRRRRHIRTVNSAARSTCEWVYKCHHAGPSANPVWERMPLALQVSRLATAYTGNDYS